MPGFLLTLEGVEGVSVGWGPEPRGPRGADEMAWWVHSTIYDARAARQHFSLADPNVLSCRDK